MSQAVFSASVTPSVAGSVKLSDRQNRKVADIWGVAPPEARPGLWELPAVREYLMESLSGVRPAPGSLGDDFVERWTVDTYLRGRLPVGRMLSLCCGFGSLERSLADMGVFERCTGLDISRGAIEGARAQAAQLGYANLDYQVADLNHLELEPASCDLIWANGAIHHITGLEHLMGQIHRALRPGGLFVCNEYVGPRYQQFPHRQREIINAVIHLLPPVFREAFEETFVPVGWRYPRWKRNVYEMMRTVTLRPIAHDLEHRAARPEWSPMKRAMFGVYQALHRVKQRITGGPAEFGQVFGERSAYLRQVDPSEGVRSDDVLPIIQRTFARVDVRPLNMSILPQVIDRQFLRRFNGSSPADRAMFELLVQIEKTMLATGQVRSDYAHITAHRTA